MGRGTSLHAAPRAPPPGPSGRLKIRARAFFLGARRARARHRTRERKARAGGLFRVFVGAVRPAARPSVERAGPGAKNHLGHAAARAARRRFGLKGRTRRGATAANDFALWHGCGKGDRFLRESLQHASTHARGGSARGGAAWWGGMCSCRAGGPRDAGPRRALIHEGRRGARMQALRTSAGPRLAGASGGGSFVPKCRRFRRRRAPKKGSARAPRQSGCRAGPDEGERERGGQTPRAARRRPRPNAGAKGATPSERGGRATGRCAPTAARAPRGGGPGQLLSNTA